jgi:uroporphyrinogen III methyltransferase/synthase
MRGLAGARVLVTRAAHQAEAFAALLRAAGAEPIFAPMIAMGPPDDTAALRLAATHLDTYAWAVFTSRNAVETFLAALDETGRDASAFAGVRVAAIGPKTSDALTAHGVAVELVPQTFVNEAVATALLAHTQPGDRILIVCAQEARDVLPATLREHARRVDVVAGYATRSVADPQAARKAADADIVTFTSASTVHGFCASVPDAAHALESKIVAAIGPIAAHAAREAGIRVDVVADDFTTEGLIAALAATAATPA